MFNGKEFSKKNTSKKERYIYIPEKFGNYLYNLISSKIDFLEQETPINPESKQNDLNFLHELLKATQEPATSHGNLGFPKIDHLDLVSEGILIKQLKVYD